MIRGNSSFFITGGTLGQDTPSYVERRADSELYEGLRQGEFCYVLTARQMGKSSLMVRTANRLREDGFAVVTLDLTTVGQNLSLEQWYYGLLNLTGRQLGLRPELRAFWVAHPELGPLHRFMQALEQVVLASLDRETEPRATERPEVRGLVVFVDEIDSVLSLPFSTDELFAAIRQCYNRRAEEPALQRLTFCLLGVTSPSQLIRDARTTPFNVGRRIELHDFREPEAQPLAVGLQLGAAGDPLRPLPVAQHLLRRVLHWTAGHPYLTQRLCQAVAEDPKARDARAVDRICRDLFLTPGARHRDDNLLFVQERLVNREDDVAAYLGLYRRIRAGRRVRSDETDPRVPELRLSGIVREERGYLRVRNRIYHHVFDPQWVTAHLPDAELRRQLAAYRRGLVRGGVLATLIITSLGALATTAVIQTRRAERVLAQMQIDRGIDRLETGDGQGLLDLVDAYQTARGNPDLRRSAGLLWAGWQPVMRRRLLSQVGQEAPISALCFADRGRLLVTGADDGSARLWDTGTWQPVGPRFEHREELYSVTADEHAARLFTHAASGVKWWDLQSGRALGSWQSRAEVCTATAVSHRGALLACADGRGVYLRSLGAEGTGARELPGIGILSLAFSADDRHLYVGKMRGLEVWDLTVTPPQQRGFVAGSPVEWLSLGPQDRLLATAGGGQARLWQLPLSRALPGTLLTGEQVGEVLFQPPQGTALATLGRDEVRFLNPLGASEEGALPLHPGALHAMAFTPDGGRLATAGEDGSVQIWETALRFGPGRRLAPPAPFLAAAPAGHDRLDGITSDGYRRSWSLSTGTPLGAPVRLPAPVDGASLDTAHAQAATWHGGQVGLWDLGTNQLRARVTLGSRVEDVVFAADGGSALVTLAQGPVRLLDPLTGAARGQLAVEGSGRKRMPRVSPDGRRLAMLVGGEVILCDPRSGGVVGRPLSHPEPVSGFVFGAAGKLLASSAGSTVQLWTSTQRKFGRPLECPAPVRRLALGGEDELVAIATDAGEVRCWQTRNQQAVGVPMETSERVQHLLFDPQGRRLITIGLHSLRVWEVGTGRLAGPPVTLPAQVRSAEFSPDGRTLILACGRDLRLWELPAPDPSLRPSEDATAAALGVRRTRTGDLTRLTWQDFRRLRDAF